MAQMTARFSKQTIRNFTFLGIVLFLSAFPFVFHKPVFGLIFNHVYAERYPAIIVHRGCQTLVARNSDIAVIGDSHSRSFDFRQLQSRTGLAVGGCTLSGLSMETVSGLLRLIADHGALPERVILTTSPRMLITYRERAQQIEAHKQVLDGLIGSSAKQLFAALEDLRIYYKPGSAAKEQNARLEALDEKTLSGILTDPGRAETNLERWRKILNDAQIVSSTADDIGQICKFVLDRNIRFWAVHIPESPMLESMYPAGLLQAYRTALKGFQKCAQGVILGGARGYGIGNRHFILKGNRFIPAPGETVSQGGAKIQWDADHLNDPGGTLFTKRLIDSHGAALIKSSPNR